jgi:hypothetical protein
MRQGLYRTPINTVAPNRARLPGARDGSGESKERWSTIFKLARGFKASSQQSMAKCGDFVGAMCCARATAVTAAGYADQTIALRFMELSILPGAAIRLRAKHDEAIDVRRRCCYMEQP